MMEENREEATGIEPARVNRLAQHQLAPPIKPQAEQFILKFVIQFLQPSISNVLSEVSRAGAIYECVLSHTEAGTLTGVHWRPWQ
jgi:hypothetical protein